MTHFAEARKLRYEVYVLEAGRWRLDHTVDDGREALGRPFTVADFQRTEDGILGESRSLLASGRFQAVRVMRERTGPDGHTFSSEIFNEVAPPRRPGRPPVAVRAPSAFLTCRTLADLAGRPGCLGLAGVLRDFLGPQRVTALELLHSPFHLNKLATQSSLRQSALHALAQAQGDDAGPTPSERARRLERLLDKALATCREAQGERKLPKLEDGRFHAAWLAVEARVAESEIRHRAVFVLARALVGSGWNAKLAFAFDNIDGGLPEASARILDELVAGCLDLPEPLMDLMGPRENLGAALIAMADLAQGRTSAGQGDAALRGRLAALIAAGKLPVAADALWQRVLQELQGSAPLSRRNPAKEWPVTVDVGARVGELAPQAMAEAIEAAVRARLSRLRERES